MSSTAPDPPRLLIVDDDRLFASLLGRLLRGRFAVTSEETGRASVERLARGEEFDLVLVDLHLRDTSGVALCAELLRRWPTLRSRLVTISGDAQPTVDLQLPHLIKPFLADEVLAVAARLGVDGTRPAALESGTK